jgi:nitrous oxidase accessory protein NosD
MRRVHLEASVMQRRAAVLVVAAIAAFGLYLTPAHAGGVLVVDDDPGTGSCHAGHAGFATIQAAVDVAHPGDTIRVCPGVYEETVTVSTPRLTIKGAKWGQDARTRSQTDESEVTGGVSLLEDLITWDGFLLRDNTAGPGMYTSPTFSGYTIRNTIFQENGIGLHLGSSGVCQTWVRNNLFVANNEFTGAGAGNGIYASEGTVRVLIADNRFEDHNGAGILFADHPDGSRIRQLKVFVKRNQSVGDMTFAAFYASTQVHVAENVVAAREGDPDFPGPAAGIFVGARNHHIVVKRNRITSASGNGIDLRSSAGDPRLPEAAPEDIQVLGNKVTGVEQHGIEVDADGLGEYLVRGNLALRNKLVGIHFGPDTHGNRVAGNTARANVVFDCQDESHGGGTAGTANTWRDNVGPKASPDGICGRHHDQPKKHKRHHHKKRKHHKKKRCECSFPRRL